MEEGGLDGDQVPAVEVLVRVNPVQEDHDDKI